jgi:hypothetical protein
MGNRFAVGFFKWVSAGAVLSAVGCGGSVSPGTKSQGAQGSPEKGATTQSPPDAGSSPMNDPSAEPPGPTTPPPLPSGTTSPPGPVTVPPGPPVSRALDSNYTVGDAAPACAAQEIPISAPMTEAQFRSWLFRPWVLCSPPPSVFGTQGDVGLEISPDGTWNKLREGAGGELIRGTDAQDAGTWTLMDTSGMNGPGVLQMNFYWPDGSSIDVFPEFATSPAKMHVENNGVYAATYVAFGEAAPPQAAAALEPMTLPPGACTNPLQDIEHPATMSDVEGILLGKWLSCGGSMFAGTDDIGIEITADGLWYKLFPGATPGTGVRGGGFGHQGTWELIGTSDMNGPGSFQLNLKIAGSGTTIGHPTFFQNPRSVRMETVVGNVTFAKSE